MGRRQPAKIYEYEQNEDSEDVREVWEDVQELKEELELRVQHQKEKAAAEQDAIMMEVTALLSAERLGDVASNA